MDTTLCRLTSVFRQVLDDDTIILSPRTSADDIEGWDSLTHLTLIVNVEKVFAVRFSYTQVAMLTTVGELIEAIRRMRRRDSSPCLQM